MAKELRDVFGHGDAAWSDWEATLAGVHCAKAGGDVAAIAACCENAAPSLPATGEKTP